MTIVCEADLENSGDPDAVRVFWILKMMNEQDDLDDIDDIDDLVDLDDMNDLDDHSLADDWRYGIFVCEADL